MMRRSPLYIFFLAQGPFVQFSVLSPSVSFSRQTIVFRPYAFKFLAAAVSTPHLKVPCLHIIVIFQSRVWVLGVYSNLRDTQQSYAFGIHKLI
ncbi:hypothetical protein BGZ63DRAFT_381919 [Mariannaea sp. PMI_226]|nr:hypothetical protein BGZ63DRAFT_381919 [Mariannaea sp. PMI_226]